MSRIISHGEFGGRGNREAWNGKEVCCPNCGCVFVITPETQLQTITYPRRQVPGGVTSRVKAKYIPCPECGNTQSEIWFG